MSFDLEEASKTIKDETIRFWISNDFIIIETA